MRTKRRMLLVLPGMLVIVALLLWGLLLSARATHRDSLTAWTHVASACPVDETSQQKYDSHVHVLKFKGNETGSIFARCNIAARKIDVGGDALALEVTYTDPDGPGTTYQVRALLRRVRRTDGANFLVTEFNSNNFPASPKAQTHFVTIDHHFAFDQNAYYVEFRLTRNSSAQNPAAAVVAIVGKIL